MRISDWSSDVCSSDLDLVTMESGQSSQTHRHNFSETVLFFLGGEATVFINDTPHAVSAGDRILIHKAEYHSVATSAASGCYFLSVQTPPILSKATGFRDLEWRGGRKRVVEGKSVSVRVGLGGRRSFKKNKRKQHD